MSQQSLNLDDNWQEIKNNFIEHFQEDDLVIGENEIKYSSSGEHLKISKKGKVSGEMPLHSVEINEAEHILFHKNEVEISSGSSTYNFRK